MKLQFLLESNPTANAKTNETPRTISIPLCEGHLQKHHDIQNHILSSTLLLHLYLIMNKKIPRPYRMHLSLSMKKF